MAQLRHSKKLLHGPTRATADQAAHDADKIIYLARGPDAPSNGTLSAEDRAALDGRALEEVLAELKAEGGSAFSSGKSAFRGVSWEKRKSKWRARIHENATGKRHTLGFFNDEAAAARAYDAAAWRMRGRAALLNFPSDYLTSDDDDDDEPAEAAAAAAAAGFEEAAAVAAVAAAAKAAAAAAGAAAAAAAEPAAPPAASGGPEGPAPETAPEAAAMAVPSAPRRRAAAPCAAAVAADAMAEWLAGGAGGGGWWEDSSDDDEAAGGPAVAAAVAASTPSSSPSCCGLCRPAERPAQLWRGRLAWRQQRERLQVQVAERLRAEEAEDEAAAAVAGQAGAAPAAAQEPAAAAAAEAGPAGAADASGGPKLQSRGTSASSQAAAAAPLQDPPMLAAPAGPQLPNAAAGGAGAAAGCDPVPAAAASGERTAAAAAPPAAAAVAAPGGEPFGCLPPLSPTAAAALEQLAMEWEPLPGLDFDRVPGMDPSSWSSCCSGSDADMDDTESNLELPSGEEAPQRQDAAAAGAGGAPMVPPACSPARACQAGAGEPGAGSSRPEERAAAGGEPGGALPPTLRQEPQQQQEGGSGGPRAEPSPPPPQQRLVSTASGEAPRKRAGRKRRRQEHYEMRQEDESDGSGADSPPEGCCWRDTASPRMPSYSEPSSEEEEEGEREWAAGLLPPQGAPGPGPAAGRGPAASGLALLPLVDLAAARRTAKAAAGPFRPSSIPQLRLELGGDAKEDTLAALRAVMVEADGDHMPSHMRAYRIGGLARRFCPGFPLDELAARGRPVEGEYCPVVLQAPGGDPDAPAAAAATASVAAARLPPQVLALPGCSYRGQKAAARRATAAAADAAAAAGDCAGAARLALVGAEPLAPALLMPLGPGGAGRPGGGRPLAHAQPLRPGATGCWTQEQAAASSRGTSAPVVTAHPHVYSSASALLRDLAPATAAAAGAAAASAAATLLAPQPLEVDWAHGLDIAGAPGLLGAPAAELLGGELACADELEAAGSGASAGRRPDGAVAAAALVATGAAAGGGSPPQAQRQRSCEDLRAVVGFVKADDCPVVSAAREARLGLGLRMPRPLAVPHAYHEAAPAAGAALAALACAPCRGGAGDTEGAKPAAAGSAGDATRVSFGQAEHEQRARADASGAHVSRLSREWQGEDPDGWALARRLGRRGLDRRLEAAQRGRAAMWRAAAAQPGWSPVPEHLQRAWGGDAGTVGEGAGGSRQMGSAAKGL